MSKLSTDSEYRLGILLLAAGASRRFKSIKQLASLNEHGAESQMLLQMALQKVSQLPALERVVALGANKETILASLSLPDNVSVNYVSDWQEGIAASIRSGTKILQSSPSSLSHIMVLLADQPALAVSDYNQLIAASRNNLQNIICAWYGQKNAVPAIFPACYFSLLRELEGDKGAGKALNSKTLITDVISIEMLQGAEDIDTQADLTRYRKKYKNND